MDMQAVQALVRFGLGRRGTEPLPGDPARWLAGQLQGPDPARIASAPSTARGLAALQAEREQRLAGRRLAATPAVAPGAMAPGEMVPGGATPAVVTPNGVTPGAPSGEKPGQRAAPSPTRAVFEADARAELGNALTTPTPFRERLVWFWTNHFTVSIRQGGCQPLVGAFIEEAIRPNVTGRFEAMVQAVMHHPAMLLYLQNAESVGPDSPAGQRSHRGLNENLARECMELHTVSPAAGYSQADVTNFARILTGWSVELRGEPPGFLFRPRAHEPGTPPMMGHVFPPGEAGGEAALHFLANHPSTHRFLATKLTRHFVADDPPPDAVRAIEAVLRDTGGNLGAAALAITTLPAAWQPGTKFKTPQELVVSSARALSLDVEAMPGLVGILGGLGQPMWNAPAPNGWSDRAADWAAPEAMMRRVDWAYGFSARIGDRDPVELADAMLGPRLQDATLTAMRHAGSRRDAFTLLLTSPEFQRR
jgi:uncharacterized protein (DUF1800 family)